MSEVFDREAIVGLLRTVTTEVFTTMLSIDLQTGDAFMEAQRHGSQGVMSFIGLGGKGVGTGGLCCSSDTACRLASSFLLGEYHAVDDEVLDVIGELTNMILGSLKTHLEGTLGPMTLSIPTVVHGQNFVARTLSREEWTVVPFSWDEGRLEVKIYLEPARDTKGFARGEKPEFLLAG